MRPRGCGGWPVCAGAFCGGRLDALIGTPSTTDGRALSVTRDRPENRANLTAGRKSAQAGKAARRPARGARSFEPMVALISAIEILVLFLGPTCAYPFRRRVDRAPSGSWTATTSSRSSQPIDHSSAAAGRARSAKPARPDLNARWRSGLLLPQFPPTTSETDGSNGRPAAPRRLRDAIDQGQNDLAEFHLHGGHPLEVRLQLALQLLDLVAAGRITRCPILPVRLRDRQLLTALPTTGSSV